MLITIYMVAVKRHLGCTLKSIRTHMRTRVGRRVNHWTLAKIHIADMFHFPLERRCD